KAAPRGAAPPPAEAPPAGAPAAAPAAPSGGGAGPASSVAGQRSKTEVQVALALEQGHRALAAQDARSALAQFESALQADDRNLSAMLGRGASQLALGKAAEALSTVERARALNPRHADPYFWLACAQLRLNKRAQALEALKGAVGRGWAAPEGHWLVDAELKRLSDAGAEFQPLLKQARSRKRPASREPQGFGSASP
ncbi:tetratricopeptide repeat protein, partial [Corallococcus sp. M34]|uniref:tetratricopeptide repeat protein n=1 Tax=Citreicoccus inhibens TaxID=2849499 RepID=UPI001C225E00|nr:tetratricopeptide repeat protein [Citreicoccus inhibens]